MRPKIGRRTASTSSTAWNRQSVCTVRRDPPTNRVSPVVRSASAFGGWKPVTSGTAPSTPPTRTAGSVRVRPGRPSTIRSKTRALSPGCWPLATSHRRRPGDSAFPRAALVPNSGAPSVKRRGQSRRRCRSLRCRRRGALDQARIARGAQVAASRPARRRSDPWERMTTFQPALPGRAPTELVTTAKAGGTPHGCSTQWSLQTPAPGLEPAGRNRVRMIFRPIFFPATRPASSLNWKWIPRRSAIGRPPKRRRRIRCTSGPRSPVAHRRRRRRCGQ